MCPCRTDKHLWHAEKLGQAAGTRDGPKVLHNVPASNNVQLWLVMPGRAPCMDTKVP